MRRYKIAIVGCGRIMPSHIISIIKNRRLYELVAVCDIDKNKTKKAIKLHKALNFSSFFKIKKVTAYTDIDEMLENEDIDIVSILTPSGLHYEHSIKCLKKKKHVLVEKPMAMNINEANEMNKIADLNKVKLGVCFQKRYNKSIVKLKKAIDEGRFGKIFVINARTYWSRDESYYKSDAWRGTKQYDGGTLMNQSIHVIDIVTWLVGSNIVEFNSVIENYNHPYNEVEDYASIQIVFENGLISNIESTVNIVDDNYSETITVIGEKGFVEIGGLAINKILEWRFTDKISNLKANEQIKGVYGKGHATLYKNFANSLRNNNENYISGKEGIKALYVVNRAYKEI